MIVKGQSGSVEPGAGSHTPPMTGDKTNGNMHVAVLSRLGPSSPARRVVDPPSSEEHGLTVSGLQEKRELTYKRRRMPDQVRHVGVMRLPRPREARGLAMTRIAWGSTVPHTVG